MKNLMLPCLVSLTLAITTPTLFAGSQAAEKTAPVAKTSTKAHDLAPVGGRSTDAPETSRTQRLDVRLHAIDGEGLQFEIRHLDGIDGRAYLIVFFQMENQLVLLDIRDGSNEDALRFDLDLDVFAQMPVAVMPVRIRHSGAIDLGPVQSAADLAERADH